MLFAMSPSPAPSAWCADLQAKLMAAIDAAWALAEASDDPAVIAKARDKARLCGQRATRASRPPPRPWRCRRR